MKLKENNINNKLFKEYLTDYQSPSNINKKSSKTEDEINTEGATEARHERINKINVDFIQKNLIKLQRTFDYMPIGTPNQMLSRLPIFFSSIKK